MANWICIYCLGVSPVFLVLSLPSAFGSAGSVGTSSPAFALVLFWDVATLLADVMVTLVLFWGGLKLKRLKASAKEWITWGLYFSLGIMCIRAITAIAAPDINEPTPDSVIVIGLVVALLFVATLVFKIAAVVWLHRHGHELPVGEGGLR